MITDYFISFGIAIINYLISLLPLSAGLPATVVTGATYIGGYFAMLDPIVPVSTLGTVVALAFSVEITIWTFKLVLWLFSFTPFIGRK